MVLCLITFFFFLDDTVALCSGTDDVFVFGYQQIKRHFDCDADVTKHSLVISL